MPSLSAGCNACCRVERNLLEVDRLISEKDVTKAALGDRSDGEGYALFDGNEWGKANMGGVGLRSSIFSSLEGMKRRSSLP